MQMIVIEEKKPYSIVLSHLKARGADWRGAVVTDVEIAFSNLNGADLTGAVFYNVLFIATDLVSAKVDGAQFIHCKFDHTNLDRCIGTPEVIDCEVIDG